MVDRWPVAPLGLLVDEIIDRRGVTPLKLGSNFVGSGHRVISAKAIKDRRIDLMADEPRFVDEATYRKWMKTPLRTDDVILTSEAPLGETAYISVDCEWCLGQRLFGIRTKKNRMSGRFLLYALQSSEVRDDLLSRATGTTAQGIRQSELRLIAIPVPALDEQRAIAYILGALDDKIELNRRMSGTLEQMAGVLFKSWFVDFDPVRAKVEGSDLRLAKPLGNDFADRLADSIIGAIPEGWDVKRLEQCIDVARGLSYKGSGLSDDGVPMHNLNSIYEGGGYKHDGLKHYTGDFKSEHIARSGDVIVANTEQGHDRLLIGYAAIVPRRFGQESIFSHHIYRVRPKPGSGLTADYVSHLLNSRGMHQIVSGYANGTTVNMLPLDSLQSPLILVPPRELISSFTQFAEAARTRCDEMFNESRTLAALRDTLLPRLISGELRIKDAERFLERAGV